MRTNIAKNYVEHEVLFHKRNSKEKATRGEYICPMAVINKQVTINYSVLQCARQGMQICLIITLPFEVVSLFTLGLAFEGIQR